MALRMLPDESLRISSPVMRLAEPVKPSFLRSKIPVTTTSSIVWASSAKVMLSGLPSHVTVLVAMPMNEKVNDLTLFPSGNVMENVPSARVTAFRL